MELYGYEMHREKDLSHHGILGQKWGVRRYQNPDGTLTNAGKKRYGEFGIDNRPSHKQISDERFKIATRKTNALLSKDETMQGYMQIIDSFEKKYGLDKMESADAQSDYFDRLEQKSHKDSKLAAELEEYETASSNYAKNFSKYHEEGQKYADQKILAKYGKEAARDTYKTDKVQTGAIIVGGILLSPIIIPAALITVAVSSAIPHKKKDSSKPKASK